MYIKVSYYIINIFYLGQKPSSCPPNMARCGNSTQCKYIESFCDGTTHCENSTDEGSFCGKIIMS